MQFRYMNIALILFTLGVIMVVSGYTNQVSPHCNTKLKVKVVPRGVQEEEDEESVTIE